jgi:hypothetical protein
VTTLNGAQTRGGDSRVLAASQKPIECGLFR